MITDHKCANLNFFWLYVYNLHCISASASDRSRPGYQIIYKVEEKRLFSGGVNTLVGQNDASLVSFNMFEYSDTLV